jgi:superfamily II DNA or RNA helicase
LPSSESHNDIPVAHSSKKLPTILDNRADNTVLAAFKRLLPHTRQWDVATGYFEIGSLLDLDGLWQKLDGMRVLLGDEMTRRTREELVLSLQAQSDESIESKKEKDDGLTGLFAIRDALAAGRIQPRIYSQAKFHSKGYIMEGGDSSLVDYAVVGSSNFTHPGLTQNIELNLLTTEQNQIAALRAWYEEVWAMGEDVSPEVLQVIERHLRAYKPFEVYAKALYEYFRGREKSATGWEERDSVIYKMLSQYQKDGYHRALQIADDWDGALVCDGVGLGKTFIGLMLLEHALYHKKKALIIVPKSARSSVWERNLDQYLKPKYRRAFREQIVIRSHTDFGRDGTVSVEDYEYYKDFFDVILVDEAHHFRHPHRTRARKLMDLCTGKKVYLLTATPINNSLTDLYNLINFFAQNDPRHFSQIGIQNLRLHFSKAEKALREEAERGGAVEPQTDPTEAVLVQATDFLRTDTLLKEVLIQRSRRYVKESEALSPNPPRFPSRQLPVVVTYSLDKVYAGIYEDIKLAFQSKEPMLSLAIYNTERFKRSEGDKDKALLDAQGNILGLIRTLLLKRLESSYKAFEASLEDLLRKMGLFVEANAPDMWNTWQKQHTNLWTTALLHWREREIEDDEEENDVPELPEKLDPEKYDVSSILTLTLGDMTQLVSILTKVYQKLSPSSDDKLTQLKNLLDSDDLKGKKLVIFTEFRDTARYLYKELCSAQPNAKIEELDSGRYPGEQREKIIKRFAPYYNCSEAELPSYLNNQIDILVTTDVLSEGLNLQDANQLINYDVHWNPVRLMQRVGRVDRRLDMSKPVHHDKVYIYNFLPPQELEDLLNLLKRVSGKILRINRTLGIEAPILRPDDPDAAMKLFNEQYEQQESITEALELELARIAKDHPETYHELPGLPRRVFSGKKAVDQPIGLFAAYRFPAASEDSIGELRWYFRRSDNGQIIEGIEAIANAIRCTTDTARETVMGADDLKAARKQIESQKVDRHLRDMQALAGSKATLVCWMEVC